MEKEKAEIIGKLNKSITEHGFRIDAFIPLLNKIDKQIELLEKIQRGLYFSEDRQKKILEIMEKLEKNFIK